MKNLALTLVLFVLPLIAFGQSSEAEKIFDQFANKKGFTTITISKSLFKMMSKVDTNDPDFEKIKYFANKLDDFKILVDEDGTLGLGNKLKDLTKKLDKKGYDELMSVNSDGTMVSFKAIQNGGFIKELILSVADGESNVLMLIKGNFTMDDFVAISDLTGIDGMENMKELKNK